MSTWLKDNKSIATVIGIGTLAFLGLTTFGVIQYLDKSKITDEFKQTQRQISTAASQPLPPNPFVVENHVAQVNDYANLLKSIEDSYDQFRPTTSELANISPEEFRNNMNATVDSFKKKAAEQNVKFKNDLRLGFDAYATIPAIQQATGTLNYQLNAIYWLMERALDSDVTEITRVYRERLPIESAPQAAKAEPRSAGRATAARTPARSATKAEPYQKMPISLTLKGKRRAIAKLINEITESDKYLFTIQAFRTQTENAGAQTIANKPATPTATAPRPRGGALNLAFGNNPPPAGGAANAPEENAAKEVLVPVIGSEQVDFHIVLNLILLEPKETGVAAPADNSEAAPAEEVAPGAEPAAEGEE